MDEAKAALTTLYTSLWKLEATDSSDETVHDVAFCKAMDDDFNTPEAIAVLFGVAKEINRIKEKDKNQAAILAGVLIRLGTNLGLLEGDANDFLQGGVTQGLPESEIDQMILARQVAKQTKNWAESDRIRDELAEQGVVLEDNADGTTWRRE